MVEKIVWQPRWTKNGVEVHLDVDFAREMNNKTLSSDRRSYMNSIGHELLRALGFEYNYNPFAFYQNSPLVSHCHISRRTSLGLVENQAAILIRPDYNKVITYSSDSAENEKQKAALLRLFNLWAEQARGLGQ